MICFVDGCKKNGDPDKMGLCRSHYWELPPSIRLSIWHKDNSAWITRDSLKKQLESQQSLKRFSSPAPRALD